MPTWTIRTLRTVAVPTFVTWTVILAAAPLLATGTLGVDAATLNQLLPALASEEFEVAILGEQTVTVRLEDLRVTGFDPAAGGGSTGQILTQVRVEILELGFTATVEPRLSLAVVERRGQSLLLMRFEQAQIPLPLLGDVDIGRLIPPLEFPAESLFVLQGASSEVPMRGWLTGVKMGQRVLQFEFELEPEGEE